MKEVDDALHVMGYREHLDDYPKLIKDILKNLKPYDGRFEIIIGFSEPNTDIRFKLGHFGAEIQVRAVDLKDVVLLQKALGYEK